MVTLSFSSIWKVLWRWGKKSIIRSGTPHHAHTHHTHTHTHTHTRNPSLHSGYNDFIQYSECFLQTCFYATLVFSFLFDILNSSGWSPVTPVDTINKYMQPFCLWDSISWRWLPVAVGWLAAQLWEPNQITTLVLGCDFLFAVNNRWRGQIFSSAEWKMSPTVETPWGVLEGWEDGQHLTIPAMCYHYIWIPILTEHRSNLCGKKHLHFGLISQIVLLLWGDLAEVQEHAALSTAQQT